VGLWVSGVAGERSPAAGGAGRARSWSPAGVGTPLDGGVSFQKGEVTHMSACHAPHPRPDVDFLKPRCLRARGGGVTGGGWGADSGSPTPHKAFKDWVVQASWDSGDDSALPLIPQQKTEAQREESARSRSRSVGLSLGPNPVLL
jgi:hypothetical protein